MINFIRQQFPLKEIVYRIFILGGLGCVIGTVVSILSLLFLNAISWMNDQFLISPSQRIRFADDPFVLNIVTIVVPTLGGLLVGLIIRFLVEAKRSLGPPDTVLMVQTRSGGESIGSGIASTLAAMVSLGVGASVGQYGPLVYLGTVIGQITCKLNIDIRNLQAVCVASGVAAAISATFNAPIAGLVFAHEVVLRHYSIKAFAPTAVATAIGFVIVNVIFDRSPLFLVEFQGVEHSYEFIFFAIVGILSSFVAIIYGRGILSFGKFANRTGIPIQFRPMIAGFILGVVAIWIPDVLGIGGTTLRFATIDHAFEINELAIIIVAKMAVTIICIGFGFAGGVFSPILLIGILFGALCGGFLDDATAIANSGIIPYAICGMMAATSSIIGAPLATILIVFELTHNYDLAIAAMVAVVFSNLVSCRIFGRSLYDVQLSERGFDLSLGRITALTAYEKITKIMHNQYLRFHPDDRIEDVISKLSASGYEEGIVVQNDDTFVGVVSLPACSARDPTETVGNVVDRNPLMFTEFTNVDEAVEAFRIFIVDIAPVVSSDDNKILGVVWDYDVINSYLRTIERLRREENESI